MELPPSQPSSPHSGHWWEPSTPLLQGHPQTVLGAALAHADCAVRKYEQGQTLASQAAPERSGSSSRAAGSAATTRCSSPCRARFIHLPASRAQHAPALGSYLPCEI